MSSSPGSSTKQSRVEVFLFIHCPHFDLTCFFRPTGELGGHCVCRSSWPDYENGAMTSEMTRDWLRYVCKENGGYSVPHLNDTLYLHFKGFDRIKNLDEYTAVRSIFLEGNALESLDGLEHCSNLRCLYVQQNMIATLSSTLPTSITVLNLSYNDISDLENIGRLVNLQTFVVRCSIKLS